MLGAAWWPRRRRFRDFEVRRFGTAMVSSNRFGGQRAGARPRVQVCPTLGAESRTVITAEQERGLRRQRELLTDDLGEVDVGGALRQRVKSGILGGLGIGGEHRGGHVDIHFIQYFGQAAAALAPHDAMNPAAPEVFSVARHLELAVDRDRASEAEPQALEHLVVGIEPSVGPHGTALEIPNVHSQHSRLKYLGQRLGSRLRHQLQRPASSPSGKKNATSLAAFSSVSEAWIAFFPFDSA